MPLTSLSKIGRDILPNLTWQVAILPLSNNIIHYEQTLVCTIFLPSGPLIYYCVDFSYPREYLLERLKGVLHFLGSIFSMILSSLFHILQSFCPRKVLFLRFCLF